MGSEYNLISADAQRALEEFSQEFAMALIQSPVEQWARALGTYRQSRALKTTWPIPISAAGYKEFKGDIKYRGLFEKSLTMTQKTWQDGVAELASVIEAPDFIGWTSEPAAIAEAGMSLSNEIIAGLLEANAVQDFDGKAFFASDHPINVVKDGAGTFDNDITGAGTDPTIANLQLAKVGFRALKGANGKPLGLRMTHVVAPAAQEEIWKDLLELDMILQSNEAGDAAVALPNRHKGTVKLVISDELTDASKWYPCAFNKPGAFPWVAQDEGVPEQLVSDKTSALYHTTLKVGIAWILRGNGALALPQTMQRWAGTP